jgi:hypothetical protein
LANIEFDQHADALSVSSTIVAVPIFPMERENIAVTEKRRLDMDRMEQEQNERLEQERLEKERLEKERLENERLEQERLEKERLEQERLEQERLEQERLEKDRLEQERLEKERLEQERLERIEQERLEQERLEQERLEQERLEKERLENERLERLEQERLEEEQMEKERLRIAIRSRLGTSSLPPVAVEYLSSHASTVEAPTPKTPEVVEGSDEADIPPAPAGPADMPPLSPQNFSSPQPGSAPAVTSPTMEMMTQLMIQQMATQQLLTQQMLIQLGDRQLGNGQVVRFPEPLVGSVSPPSSRYAPPAAMRGIAFDLPRGTSGVAAARTGTSRPSPAKRTETMNDQVPATRLSNSPGGSSVAMEGSAKGADEGEMGSDAKALIPSVFAAVRHNKYESVETIVRENPQMISAVEDERKQNTLLHVACSNGYARIAKLLIKAGANVDACNADGNTPLHLCYQYGRLALVSILIASNANENARNKKDLFPAQLLTPTGGSGVMN